MGEMFIHHHFLRAPIIEKFVFFCFRCFVLKKSPFTRMNFAIHFDRTRPQRLFFFSFGLKPCHPQKGQMGWTAAVTCCKRQTKLQTEELTNFNQNAAKCCKN